jgi:hypothetical protein
MRLADFHLMMMVKKDALSTLPQSLKIGFFLYVWAFFNAKLSHGF